MRARNWCFTLNNPTAEDYDFWEAIGEWEHKGIIRYVILQEEIGEEGLNHFQGYIELKRPIRLRRMKIYFGDRYHFEKRLGSQAAAIAYCRKADSRVEDGLSIEWGTKKRGSNGKFHEAVMAIADGMMIDEVEEEYTEQFVMFKDKLQDFALHLKGKRHWAMDVRIYVGKTGSGKSYTADQEDDHYNAPWLKGGRWWWEGYTGQFCVVLDEFRHQLKMDVMLKVFDRYAWHLEAKGRSFQFVSHKIVITTNIDPKDWYPGVSVEKKEPLRRRIQEFAKIYDFPDTAESWPTFRKILRTEPFHFNVHERPDQLVEPQAGGYNAGGYNFGGA